VPFGVVDIFQVGVIGYFRYSLLQGNDLVIASHDGDGAELKAFCQMHSGNADFVADRFNAVVEHD
jgi:hypothetical protein